MIVSGFAGLVMTSIFPSLLTSRNRQFSHVSFMLLVRSLKIKSIFGYQGRYEMRTKRNMVCGQMRDVFDYWHLDVFFFTSKPYLNWSFVMCTPDKRIFAAPSEPGFIVQFANLIKAWRPMPIQSDPGLIDHN